MSSSSNSASPSSVGSPTSGTGYGELKARSHERPAYGYREMHADLEAGKIIGCYGADHAPYHGLASVRMGVDMGLSQSRHSPYETLVPELEAILHRPDVQKNWESIFTFDPAGVWAKRPTISATYANMSIPELMPTLEPDGLIVNEDRSIKCIKCAIDHVWNLPSLASQLGMDEGVMRRALSEATQNTELLDTTRSSYLPPVGGITVYFIGDPSRLADPSTEVAVRCHDACCGSDVFGTDICTCRPYLIYAIQGCVEAAKRGGVGVIAYFRKEGRSLGEVVKFRVYNARKAQPGGDTPENYFKVTESIAGIRDARFQEMMPDVLLWLGIRRIDWLLSMSAEKYDAITAGGIKVMQRVSLPTEYIPPAASVEISAKIAAGYHTESLDREGLINDLRTLDCVRARCQQVLDLARRKKTRHFVLDESKLDDCVERVIKCTTASYPALAGTPRLFEVVPYHSRWRHINDGAIARIKAKWPTEVDAKERARRLIDLVTVSVLLDAGAGDGWSYHDEEGIKQVRSEGLAAASEAMYREGIFSSDVALPNRVNSAGLRALQLRQLAKGLQVSEGNPIIGLEGRYSLLQRLAAALDASPEFFGAEVPRPGNLVDYILRSATPAATSTVASVATTSSNSSSFSSSGAAAAAAASSATKYTVSLRVLWRAIVEGLERIWPSDTHTAIARGDAWGYSPLKKIGSPASDVIPFHKLSQWLTYSLLEPLEELGITFTDMHLLTGLAEYRNGGLFIDAGVLTLNKEDVESTASRTGGLQVGSEIVVEWRALTVALLDIVAERVRARLGGLSAEALPLAKILQGGTWAAGRIIAKEKRADGSPPLKIRLDGTVF